MERMVIEYLANALWQLPVLALGAWLLLRMWSPGPAARHRVWLAVLALGLLLPLRGVVGSATTELSFSGVALRPASLSYVDGQEIQNNVGVDFGSTTTAEKASSSHPSLNHPTDEDSVGAPAREGWGTRAFSAWVQRVSVSAAVLDWIVGLWLAVALWGLARLAMAWRSARRLVADSREAALDERERGALLECARRIGVEAPEVRGSDMLAGPVVVGAARPVLLWPEGFAQYSGDELRAALLHELAHVRRRDYGMNLLCEAAALPLKWHPVTHAVERQIRVTREMACDAMAAEAMESETIYAECLVRLARSIAGGGLAESPAVAGLFNGNVMEERVMRLMRGKSAMSMRARVARGAVGAAAMVAAIVLAGAFHVVPAMAQEQVVAPVQSAPSAVPSAPPVPSAPSVVPAVPPAPRAQIGTPPPPPPPLTEPAAPQAPQTPMVAPPRIPAAPPVPATAPPAPPVPQTPAAAPPRAHREKPVVIMNGQERELTPAERARIEKQLAEAQERIAEATAKINSPEFRRKIQAEIDAAAKVNSAEFQKQMADAQKQILEARARWNSPEFRKQIEDATRAAASVNSAEIQKQMADAQRQILEARARWNSPEFRKQIEDATRAAASVNSAEIQKQMADTQRQIADALATLRTEQEKKSAK